MILEPTLYYAGGGALLLSSSLPHQISNLALWRRRRDRRGSDGIRYVPLNNEVDRCGVWWCVHTCFDNRLEKGMNFLEKSYEIA